MYFLITITTITLLLIIGYIICRKKFHIFSIVRDIVEILLIISCVVLFFTIISIPICRLNSNDRIIEYNTRKETILEQRNNKNISELENVQMYKEIVDANAWLETTKYWANNKWFNIYYSQEVNNLTPIK